MKLHTILFNLLFMNIILLNASTISSLIQQAKKAPQKERFKIMNQIKLKIASMNEQDKASAIAQIRASRQHKKLHRNRFAKEALSKVKVRVTAELLAKQQAREENGVRRGAPTVQQLARIKARMTPEQRARFDARVRRFQGNKKPPHKR